MVNEVRKEIKGVSLQEILTCVFWLAMGIEGSAIAWGYGYGLLLFLTVPLGIIGFMSLLTAIEMRRKVIDFNKSI